MKNSSRYFTNKDCEFYPCHKDIKDQNCLFCYCPWFWDCGSRIAGLDCKDCTFPHDERNYDLMIEGLRNIYNLRIKKEKI